MDTKTKKQILQEKYAEILNALHFKVNHDTGGITHVATGQPPQTVVDGKTLPIIFPTDTVLKEAHQYKDKALIFHPLCENIYGKNSLVLTQLRYMIEAQVFRTITYSGYILLEAVVNSSDELTETQLKTVSNLTGADKKLLDSYMSLLDSIEVLKNPRLVSFFIKRGGELNDEKVKRLCTVSFPLVTSIYENDDAVINGIKFRKKDLPILRELFKIILPDIETLHAYSAGSNSNVAPSLIALLEAYSKTLNHTASVTWEFRALTKDLIETPLHTNKHSIDDALHDEMELTDLTSVIPELPGNYGEPIGAEKEGTSNKANSRAHKLTTKETPVARGRIYEKEEEEEVVIRGTERSPAQSRRPRGQVQSNTGGRGRVEPMRSAVRGQVQPEPTRRERVTERRVTQEAPVVERPSRVASSRATPRRESVSVRGQSRATESRGGRSVRGVREVERTSHAVRGQQHVPEVSSHVRGQRTAVAPRTEGRRAVRGQR